MKDTIDRCREATLVNVVSCLLKECNSVFMSRKISKLGEDGVLHIAFN